MTLFTFVLGNRVILASVTIAAVAVMMMLSIMPAMAQPIGDPVSDIPLTDANAKACTAIKEIVKKMKARGQTIPEGIKIALVKACL